MWDIPSIRKTRLRLIQVPQQFSTGRARILIHPEILRQPAAAFVVPGFQFPVSRSDCLIQNGKRETGNRGNQSCALQEIVAWKNQHAFACSPSLDSSKRFKIPAIMIFIVTKYVNVSVTCANSKIPGRWAVPLILNLPYLQNLFPKDEAERILFGLVSGIALNLYFAHNPAPVSVKKQCHPLIIIVTNVECRMTNKDTGQQPPQLRLFPFVTRHSSFVLAHGLAATTAITSVSIRHSSFVIRPLF
jgi:hypothetical protein